MILSLIPNIQPPENSSDEFGEENAGNQPIRDNRETWKTAFPLIDPIQKGRNRRTRGYTNPTNKSTSAPPNEDWKDEALSTLNATDADHSIGRLHRHTYKTTRLKYSVVNVGLDFTTSELLRSLNTPAIAS